MCRTETGQNWSPFDLIFRKLKCGLLVSFLPDSRIQGSPCLPPAGQAAAAAGAQRMTPLSSQWSIVPSAFQTQISATSIPYLMHSDSLAAYDLVCPNISDSFLA